MHAQRLSGRLFPLRKARKGETDPTCGLRCPLRPRPADICTFAHTVTISITAGAWLSRRPGSSHGRRVRAVSPSPGKGREAQSRRGHCRFPRHQQPPNPSVRHRHAARHVRAERGSPALPQCFSTPGRAHCPRKSGEGGGNGGLYHGRRALSCRRVAGGRSAPREAAPRVS